MFKTIDPKELKINRHELSARMSAPCDLENGTVAKLYGELLSVAKPAYVATRVKLNRHNGGVTLGNFNSESRALIKISDGCSSLIALVATLGIGVDRLILKRAQISAAETFVLDALADALIEALCDLAEDEVKSDLATSGRVSPGYSDIELSLGKELIALTGAGKTLGIKFSENGMMIPQKSVNALIAVKDV